MENQKTKSSAASAISKCIVWFYDGNSRTFYSRDLSHKKAKPNAALGIRRLEKMLFETFPGKWETAVIYENQPAGKELAKYKKGIRI